MFGVRIHGRGGQGVVTAAELLSVAAFAEGRHAQAFPSFGSERTGAPVSAYCRLDTRPIRTREPIAAADCVIVQDPTLLGHVDVLTGLRPDGSVLVNWAGPVHQLGVELPPTTVAVAATDLALRHIGRAVPNAALLGAFAALTRQVRLESVLDAIRQRFPGPLATANVAAAQAAYELVRAECEERQHA
ncbi:2-oxoacid:acceptor oxidoreductase [Micromonospora globispora]|uniref:2-oxoacid:acceptor oxidoreductase n=2 Tax=Micromonospora globispora TaxID=1450148 RepID=A0A317K3X7_9ACTN|nr:2-oxoacid:acceptor oxidoreductase [Micromonospora globispora]PWU54881.1 2-oxoacid:acceptor oxidoreductase [Micromonospora globispora]RQW86880.1 2-oxoacid:acceptor oxidoreductase [Micromonospora globispora]